MCDSLYRFTFISAKFTGPTHESVAFSASSYAEKLRTGKLPLGYWIAADDANMCSENIITPLRKAEAEPGSSGDASSFFIITPHAY